MYVGLENPTSPRLNHLRLRLGCGRGGRDLVELELTGAGLDLLGGTALPELVAAVEPEDQAGDADDREDDEDRHGRGLALVQSVVVVAAAAAAAAVRGAGRGDRVRLVHRELVDLYIRQLDVDGRVTQHAARAELRAGVQVQVGLEAAVRNSRF